MLARIFKHGNMIQMEGEMKCNFPIYVSHRPTFFCIFNSLQCSLIIQMPYAWEFPCEPKRHQIAREGNNCGNQKILKKNTEQINKQMLQGRFKNEDCSESEKEEFKNVVDTWIGKALKEDALKHLFNFHTFVESLSIDEVPGCGCIHLYCALTISLKQISNENIFIFVENAFT